MNLKSDQGGYKREVVGVLIAATFVFLAIAFLSYDPKDNTLLNYSSMRLWTANWGGGLGANIAALFFYLLGSMAYIFLLGLLVPVYVLFFKGAKEKLWSKLFCQSLILFSLATFCSILKFDITKSKAGGLIGASLQIFLYSAIGAAGTIIFLLAVMWVSFSIFFELPLIPFIKLSLLRCKTFFYDFGISIKAKFSRLFRRQEKHDVVVDFSQNDLPESSVAGGATKLGDDEPWDSLLAEDEEAAKASEPGETVKKSKKYKLPDLNIFAGKKARSDKEEVAKECAQRAKMLDEKLDHFGVKGRVDAIKPGPLITMFEYKPEIDSKISKITALEDDLAMALTAQSIRIIAPIPGKNAVGFEIANASREDVLISQAIQGEEFKNPKILLPLVFGVDVVGNPVIEDMVKMPHLLIGGATGSGKSVGLNVMLVSLLCSKKPEELRLILIDPKRLEFTPYADVPHLLFPIITEPNRAVQALKWVVQEMEERYEIMSKVGVRNVVEYQKYEREGRSASDGALLKQMPFIVVIIDELADLMIVAGKDVEMQIVRIAQMARAAGIHMIVATQRPSVDVVTGLIKVNFPSRVAFRVSSKVDSRTILDAQGAEKLLGRGDMLYMNSASSDLKRVHGAYVSDAEIEKLTEHLRQEAKPQYLDLLDVLKNAESQSGVGEVEDELYPQILDFVKTADEVSISMIQRKYAIGFNRSARIIEKLEYDGVVAPAQGSKPRKVLRG